MNVTRTLIVLAAQADRARDICGGLAGDPGEGMFTTGIAATAAGPATEFVSSGQIGAEFGVLLTNPDMLYAACQAAEPPINVTLAQCKALLSTSIVHDGTYATTDKDGKPVVIEETPHQLFARLGRVIVGGQAI